MQKFFWKNTKLSVLTCGTGIAAYYFLNKKNTNKQLSPDRWVDVYVWWSKRSTGDVANAGKIILKQHTTGEVGNVGHTAIATSEGIYVSYWPEWGGQLKQPVTGVHMPNLTHDIKKEGGPPDVAVRFYSLDNIALTQAFITME